LTEKADESIESSKRIQESLKKSENNTAVALKELR